MVCVCAGGLGTSHRCIGFEAGLVVVSAGAGVVGTSQRCIVVARVGVRACVCACELGSCVFVFAVCITLLIVWLGVDLRVCGGVRHISAFQRAWNVGVCVCAACRLRHSVALCLSGRSWFVSCLIGRVCGGVCVCGWFGYVTSLHWV